MNEYLVEIEINTGALDTVTVRGLRAAESERAHELFSRGSIISLWRVPGRWANLGLWSAPNEAALMELIDSLPLRPYMSVRVQALEPHPSDPRQGSGELFRSTSGLRGSQVLTPLPELKLQRRPARTKDKGRGEFELTPLPEVSVRRRAALKEKAQLAQVPEAIFTVDSSSPVSSSRRQNSPQLFTMWADADVTDLVRRTGGETPQSLRQLICSQTLATLAAHPELLNNAAGADKGLRIVEGREEGHLYAATIATSQGSGMSASSHIADAATPLVSITDSGALGIGGYVATGDDAPLQLNIGPIVRTAVVRNLSNGDEVIQIRSIVRLVLNVTSLSASPERAGSFLAALSTNLNHAAELV